MVTPNSEFEDQNQQINIELSEAAAEGIYSNLVLVSHSPSEFIIDFARLLPGPPKGKVFSRIIMTPMHAKSLIATLQENLSRYERNFGIIVPPAGPAGQGPGGQGPGGGRGPAGGPGPTGQGPGGQGPGSEFDL